MKREDARVERVNREQLKQPTQPLVMNICEKVVSKMKSFAATEQRNDEKVLKCGSAFETAAHLHPPLSVCSFALTKIKYRSFLQCSKVL